jgi:hypothetical protein
MLEKHRSDRNSLPKKEQLQRGKAESPTKGDRERKRSFQLHNI